MSRQRPEKSVQGPPVSPSEVPVTPVGFEIEEGGKGPQASRVFHVGNPSGAPSASTSGGRVSRS